MTTYRDSLLADYAVVGLGVSGLSCLRFLRARGASLIALDTRESPPGLEAAHTTLSSVAKDNSGTPGYRRLEQVRFASSFFRVSYEITYQHRTRRLMFTYRRFPAGWGVNQVILSE